MKKKAGSFFKNVLSKGKNLFKKDEKGGADNDENHDVEDFGTEEDHDFIEVGKSNKVPTQLLSNISDFAGSTLHAAD